MIINYLDVFLVCATPPDHSDCPHLLPYLAEHQDHHQDQGKEGQEDIKYQKCGRGSGKRYCLENKCYKLVISGLDICPYSIRIHCVECSKGDPLCTGGVQDQ